MAKIRMSAGEKKKQLILDVSKKLFYKQGYSATTYEDICKEADIPAGSVAYHFKSKRNLAAVIQDEFSRQNKTYMEALVGNAYSITMLMALEVLNMWKKYFEDDHLRRFVIEINVDHDIANYCFDYIRHLYQIVADEQGVEIDSNTLDFITVTQIGMTGELLIRCETNPDLYTYEEVGAYSIRVFCQLLGLRRNHIQAIIDNVLRIYPTLPIDNRYFADFEYNPKYIAAFDEAKCEREDREATIRRQK